jgi:hypothetical protein
VILLPHPGPAIVKGVEIKQIEWVLIVIMLSSTSTKSQKNARKPFGIPNQQMVAALPAITISGFQWI